MAAAYPGFALTRSDAVGWRGTVARKRGSRAQPLVQVFGSWLPLTNSSIVMPIQQQDEDEEEVAEGEAERKEEEEQEQESESEQEQEQEQEAEESGPAPVVCASVPKPSSRQCMFISRGVRCSFNWQHKGLCSFDSVVARTRHAGDAVDAHGFEWY